MKKIAELLNSYDIKEKTPIALVRESADNAVYQIGSNVKKILRVSKRLPISDIQFEYDVTTHLFAKGIKVPDILPTADGSHYSLLDGNVAVLFDYIVGKHANVSIDTLPSMNQVRNAGYAMGVMANGSVDFSSTNTRKRTILTELERAVSLADTFKNRFEGGEEFIDDVYEAISFAERESLEIKGCIHNDYRPGNVLFDDSDEVTGIIDFDWSCVGPLVKDVALAAVEWSFPDGADEPNQELFREFLAGYNSVANHKCEYDDRLIQWIKFATLSDSATYFCDLAEDHASEKRIIKSYMYRKYLYYKNIEINAF